MANTKTSMHTIETIPRFTEQDHGYHVWFMDVLDTGLLAVAGLSMKTKNTFVDLFMFQYNPDSQENPLLLMPKPYFSQEFFVCGSARRSVCLLDDRLFLTCCEHTIALYDSSNGGLLNQGKLNGLASCMTTRDSLVYVCLISRKVIVLDARELSKDRKITLKGLGVKEWPIDVTVSNNKLFICTGWYWRALMCNSEGEIEQEYINTQYSLALSITVSEEKGLIFILWNDGGEGSQVVAYSLSGGHSSISEGHSSISGGHILASFKVPDNSCRIRINNNINRLFLVTWKTGELYEYHIGDIFTVENILMCSELMIEKNDCKKLLDYFEVPAKESNAIIKSEAPLWSVIYHLREAGIASVDDISHLMTACSEKGLSKLAAVLTVYQKAQVIQKVFKDILKALEGKRQDLSHKLTEPEEERQQLTVRLKTTKEERQQFKDALKTTEEERQQFKDALKATEEERQHLYGRLKTTEEERQQRNDILKATEEERRQLKDTLKARQEGKQQFRDRLNTTEIKLKTVKDGKDELLQQQKEELEEAKSSLRATKDELVKSQLEYAKESMALQEVLKQTREALDQKQLVKRLKPLSHFPRSRDSLKRSVTQGDVAASMTWKCKNAYPERVDTGPVRAITTLRVDNDVTNSFPDLHRTEQALQPSYLLMRFPYGLLLAVTYPLRIKTDWYGTMKVASARCSQSFHTLLHTLKDIWKPHQKEFKCDL